MGLKPPKKLCQSITRMPWQDTQNMKARIGRNVTGRTQRKDRKAQAKQDRYTRQAKQDIDRTGQSGFFPCVSSPLSFPFCLFPYVSLLCLFPCVCSPLSLPICLFNILNCTSHSRPLLFPLPSGFGLWNRISTVGWGISANSRFFLSRLALLLFFALASAKARKKRRRPPLENAQIFLDLLSEFSTQDGFHPHPFCHFETVPEPALNLICIRFKICNVDRLPDFS